MTKKKYSGGILFDVSFTFIIFVLFIWSLLEYKVVSLFTPIVFLLIGSAFLYCKIYKEVSFVEKVLFWISDNVPTMRFESNHIVIGLFMATIGIASALLPSNRNMESNELLWRETRRSILFWLSLILVFLLNIIFGLYNYRKKKNS